MKNRVPLRYVFVTCSVLFTLSIAALIVWWFTSPSAWLVRAEHAIQKGNSSLAYGLLEQVLDYQPNNVHARFLMVHAAGGLSRWERSLDELQHIPIDHPHYRSAGCLTAQLLLRLGRASDAERILTRIIQEHPDAFAERRYLIELYRWEDRAEEARQHLKQIAASAPLNDLGIAIWVHMNWFLLDYGAFEQSARLDRLQQFLRQDPKDFNARLAAGRLYLQQRDIQAALPMLEEAYRDRPNDLGARFALLEYYLDFADSDPPNAAIAAHLFEGVRAESQGFLYWRLNGEYYEQQSRMVEARQAYERAIELRPDDRRSLYRLGQILGHLGEAEMSRERLGQFLELSRLIAEQDLSALVLAVSDWADRPRVPQRSDMALLDRLGRFYEKVGHTAEASRNLELARQLDSHLGGGKY